MDVEENVEDFLERVKQLDLQRQKEDEMRRKQLENEIQSYTNRESVYNISIPKPIAREEEPATKATVPNSESLQNFNKSISTQYRIDIDDLVYESAYNYEKSQNSSPVKNSFNSYNRNDDSSFRASTGSISREKTFKKYDNIPDIVRFDDAMAKSAPNYRTSNFTSSRPSRYSKFQLTDEEKKSIDSTIEGLIGGDHKVTEVQDENEQDERRIPKPLTRDRKGGQFSTPSTPQLQSNNVWSNAAKQKSTLAPPVSLSNQTSHLKRSPRKTELVTSPIRPEISSPIKKSPAKLDFSRYTSEDKHKPPPIAPKPLGFKETKNSWLGSAVNNSSSTPQWQDTTSKIQLNKPEDKKASWLNSAYKHSTSNPQWQDTTPNLQLDNANTSDPKTSWLNSAMQRTSHKEFELPKSKIKPIVPSKSNTLSKMIENDELSKQKQHSTLKELESQKLNHINSPNRPIPQLSHELNYSPTILKKTRTPSPIRQDIQEEPDFIKQRLSPTPNPASLSASHQIDAEALAYKSKLKPPLPQRKPSLDLPEALKKADKLKPALPKRKPSIKIPEALSQKEQLRQPTKMEKVGEPTPEAMSKKTQLKPALPKRKPSLKEVEALEQLQRMKSKTSSKQPPPITRSKPRVFSNSKEILQNQLGSLKSTKNLQKDEASLNLDRILKKATTDTDMKSVRLPFMTQENEFPMIKKVSTFDVGDLKKKADANEKPAENLEHLTKKRTKGPKRRAPKQK